MMGGIHVIKEGHVGIYSRGGALVPGMSEPGLNFMLPFLTKLYDVQITLQTDKVMNIPVDKDYFFFHYKIFLKKAI